MKSYSFVTKIVYKSVDHNVARKMLLEEIIKKNL